MPISSKRIALITGGGRGLGRNTVLSLAKRGIDSIFTYNSNQVEAEKVVRLVADTGQQAIALRLDTGKVSTFDPFVKGVRKALADMGAERFDYLVNNAGTSHHNAFEKTTEQELDSLYNVHFKGVFFLTQALLPLINDGGRIITISSGLTRVIIPGSASYASMKGAIEVLTRYLHRPHDRVAACRRQPLGQRPAHRSLRRNVDLNRLTWSVAKAGCAAW
jgi:NAD(P)-dependent dehydrogenase (short-subunit alcohol dehydrogenase family)